MDAVRTRGGIRYVLRGVVVSGGTGDRSFLLGLSCCVKLFCGGGEGLIYLSLPLTTLDFLVEICHGYT